MQSERSPPLIVPREIIMTISRGCVTMENIDVRYYESASPFGDWHVVVFVDGVKTDSYSAFSFPSVLEYSVRYLAHLAIEKECL